MNCEEQNVVSFGELKESCTHERRAGQVERLAHALSRSSKCLSLSFVIGKHSQIDVLQAPLLAAADHRAGAAGIVDVAGPQHLMSTNHFGQAPLEDVPVKYPGDPHRARNGIGRAIGFIQAQKPQPLLPVRQREFTGCARLSR